ncbi:AAA family ATPase [Bacillus alkalicellulosilyticus]|uniref:AAA family ATPase n=1 Tax=Alkalihalobacterium alkalicellulosilyticum TaxID=1912214 RepID=UPI000998A195|nr:AAA family ATPase [Bacillus alkalicellulosilyticus]
MRPLSLKVAGLQSFREEQYVDFSKLCEGGVFGIFGPTGSGKSSLLDAMTLALYGKVERALNNTQGIINHAEDTLAVSFTFELANGDETKKYQVERSFKRTGDVTVKTANCRFLDLTDETVVIADKANEVNAAVQELLGLSIDDFTRAVVLPQGKFAEFLSLKGTDRRQMLQRLFHLEKYGDELNHKLRIRSQKAQNEVNEVKAEQVGLGDASEEAVKEAEARVSLTEKMVSENQDKLLQAEAQFEQDKKIWNWQLEKEQAVQQVEELQQRAEEIKILEDQLEGSKQAEKLIPYIEELKESEKSHIEWTEKTKHAEVNYQNTQQRFIQSKAEYEEASQKRVNEEPSLLVRLEQLRHAEELEATITKNENDVEVIWAQVKQLTVKVEELDLQIAKEMELKKKGEERQAQLKKELESIQISSKEKEKIYVAYEEKKDIDRAQQLLTEIEADVKEQEDVLRTLTNRQMKQKEMLSTDEEQLSLLYIQTDTLYDKLCKQEQKAEQLQVYAERMYEKEKQTLEEQKVRVLAIDLAEKLQDGEACPVCGSTDHPHKLTSAHESHDESVLVQLESWKQTAGHTIQNIQQGKWQLQRLIEDIMNEEIEVSASAATIEEIDDLEQYSMADMTIDQGEALKNKLATEVSHSIEAIEELHHRGKKLMIDYRNHTEAQIETTLLLKQKQDECQRVKKKQEEAQANMEQRLANWKIDIPLETVITSYENMKETEQKVEDLRSRLEKSIPFLEEKENSIRKLQERKHEESRQEASLRSQYSEKVKAQNERKENLVKIIAGEQVQALVSTVTSTLERIKRNEQSSKEAFENNRLLLQQTEKEWAIAKESLVTASARFEKASKKWQELQQQSRFATVESVKEALRTKEELERLTLNIEHYYDKLKQVKGIIAKLEELLQGNAIARDQWEQSQQRLALMKEALQEAREARGAAVEVLKELAKKHERYSELDKRRVELEEELEKFGKLQAVFRGNAFVEFIAEEQLVQVSRDASERLLTLTRGRYAVEVDSAGGFIIRDDANGGIKRPVSSLSGGETFLTSLALALSLSASIQLRGQYPLEFFFLDEGFGTLDQDLLDTVITSLEKLHTSKLSVGVISHVPELQARLPRKLIVKPAEPSGRGSQVTVETL